MREVNPYNNKPSKKAIEPIIFRMPFFKFDSADDALEDLELGETCIAKVPNTQQYGTTHHVTLLHKDESGECYSLTMVQHTPALKPGTEAHLAKMDKKPRNNNKQPGKKFNKPVKNKRRHRGNKQKK